MIINGKRYQHRMKEGVKKKRIPTILTLTRYLGRMKTFKPQITTEITQDRLKLGKEVQRKKLEIRFDDVEISAQVKND